MADDDKEVEGGEKEDAVDYKAKVAELEGKLKEVEPVVGKYNALNERFNKDPKFQEHFKNAWEGKYEALEGKKEDIKADIKEAKKEGDTDKAAVLAEKLAKVEETLTGLTNMVGHDKVVSARASVDQEYLSTFAKLAEEKGYKPGSKAAEALFDSTIQKANAKAARFGLTRKDGTPDPLLKFSPELLNEAFKDAYETHKAMGYDIDEQNKKEILRMKREERDKKDPVIEELLKPENLKNSRARTRALEKGFKHILKREGVDPDSFKLT